MKYLVIYQPDNDPYFTQPYITKDLPSPKEAIKEWVSQHKEIFKSYQSYISRNNHKDPIDHTEPLTVFEIKDQGDLPEVISD